MTEVDAMVFTIRSIRLLLLHGSKETVAESSFIVNSNNGFAHSKVNAHPKLVPTLIRKVVVAEESISQEEHMRVIFPKSNGETVSSNPILEKSLNIKVQKS